MFSSSFSPKEISNYNRNIEHLFFRYNIPTNSNVSLEKISSENELNSDFILDLINCYHDHENIKIVDFVSYRIPILVDYLEKSHSYYINKRLPEIEQCLDKLVIQESNPLKYILLNFFEEYKNDLIKHFKKEDSLIFPYCKSLFNYYYYRTSEDLDYILDNGKEAMSFIKQHNGDKDEFKKIQDIILSYKAPSKNLSFFQVFIQQLSLFQQDLKIHAEIEDNILEKKVRAINDELKLKYA
jgi:regulator of cell morphogenesis and NO signaling